MNRLLYAELSRRLTSIIFIGEIAFLLIYNFLEIAWSFPICYMKNKQRSPIILLYSKMCPTIWNLL